MLRKFSVCIVIVLAIITSFRAHAQTPPASKTPPPAQIRKQTLAGIDKLQTWYAQSTGLYRQPAGGTPRTC